MFAKGFFMIFIMFLAIAIGGCSNTPRNAPPIVTIKHPLNVERVLVVPERVIESCKPLPDLSDGSKASVLDWAISAHGEHGVCMFRKDLSDDFLKAAAESRAFVELYKSPSTVVSTDGPTNPTDKVQ